MPSGGIEALFQPLTLRSVTLRNRVVMTPHGNRLAGAGVPTRRLGAYYEARARGGVGLIYTQTLAVYPKRPDTGPRSNVLSLWGADAPAEIGKMIKELNEMGTAIFGQVGYAGRQFDTYPLHRPTFAPSPIPWEPGGQVPREMTTAEVKRFVSYYAEAAARAVECGYNGVEIHGAHGYLIHQFLSPISNQRTDEYGGSEENRLRFAAEIAREARSAIGDDVPLGIRLSGDEFVEGGLTHEIVKRNVAKLNSLGVLDYFSMSAGAYASVERIIPPMYFPQGVHTPMAGAIKQIVGQDAAVLAAGRIYEPEFAARLIEEGTCDFVGMLRAVLADPDLPRKARQEASSLPVRKCVGLGDCWKRTAYKALPISCAINPEVTKESAIDAETIAAGTPKRLVIVGAGPSGMELAIRATQRGHQVTVFEQSPHLGGKTRIASLASGRETMRHIREYFEGAVEALGIDLRLSTSATVDSILEHTPDQVYIAVGGVPRERAQCASDEAHLFTTGLLEPELLGRRVVVYSEGMLSPAASVADTLARKGHEVSYVTVQPTVAPGLEPNTYRTLMKRLVEAGVSIVRDVEFVEWKPGALRLRNRWDTTRAQEIKADQLLYDFGFAPNVTLEEELKQANPALDVRRIGDSFSPRGIQAAYWDAYLEATRLPRLA